MLANLGEAYKKQFVHSVFSKNSQNYQEKYPILFSGFRVCTPWGFQHEGLRYDTIVHNCTHLCRLPV